MGQSVIENVRPSLIITNNDLCVSIMTARHQQ